jgi:hypothetical protein
VLSPERELRLHNDAQQPGCPHAVVTHVPHAYAGDADCLLVLAPGEVQTGEWQYHVGVIAPIADQPLGLRETSLQHAQLRQRGPRLALRPRAALGGPAAGQPQGHLGLAPAPDVAEDQPTTTRPRTS